METPSEESALLFDAISQDFLISLKKEGSCLAIVISEDGAIDLVY